MLKSNEMRQMARAEKRVKRLSQLAFQHRDIEGNHLYTAPAISTAATAVDS